MSIQGDLKTLESLEREIKIQNRKLKQLRQQKRECEARISEYCNIKELPGVKHKGTAVLVEKKTKLASKPAKQRDQDARSVLEKHGIPNPDIVLRELLEARKGDPVPIDKLKMKKYKDTS